MLAFPISKVRKHVINFHHLLHWLQITLPFLDCDAKFKHCNTFNKVNLRCLMAFYNFKQWSDCLIFVRSSIQLPNCFQRSAIIWTAEFASTAELLKWLVSYPMYVKRQQNGLFTSVSQLLHPHSRIHSTMQQRLHRKLVHYCTLRNE